MHVGRGRSVQHGDARRVALQQGRQWGRQGEFPNYPKTKIQAKLQSTENTGKHEGGGNRRTKFGLPELHHVLWRVGIVAIAKKFVAHPIVLRPANKDMFDVRSKTKDCTLRRWQGPKTKQHQP